VAATSNTQVPINVVIQFVEKEALNDLITGTSPSGASSGSQNNEYLAFDYAPVSSDIIDAINKGGNAGSSLSNVQ
jgi:hypothetical protein